MCITWQSEWSIKPYIIMQGMFFVNSNINNTTRVFNSFVKLKAPNLTVFGTGKCFTSAKGVSYLGGSGGMPPRKFLKYNTQKRHFQRFCGTQESVSQARLEFTLEFLFKK